MDKNELINFIKNITKHDFDELAFPKGMNDKTKHDFFNNNIIKKFKFFNENGKIKRKVFEYMSELLTNLLTIKNHAAIPILYKPFDSTGYDGAFLIFKKEKFDMYLSETKSSDDRYDESSNNFKTIKINESLDYLEYLVKNICGVKGSSSILEDNNNLGQIFIDKEISEQLSEENKKVLWEQYDSLINKKLVPNAIAAVMTRNDQKKSVILKDRKYKFLETVIILETIFDVKKIFDILIKKIMSFYE